DVIICPTCGQRCHLALTDVPTHPQRRPYAVHVSQTAEYHGWVLAFDVDNADAVTRQLLDSDVQDSRGGRLELVRLDREVMANDAARVCWRCRTDPRKPNRACTHPQPGSGA